jgi:hypothetical protein
MVTGIAAFAVAGGLLEVGRYFWLDEVKADAVPPVYELVEPAPYEHPAGTEDYYLFDGDFYIVNDRPEAFEDFEALFIETGDFFAATKNKDDFLAAEPTGFIFTDRKYNFKTISLGNKKLSFETEAVDGISYKFNGSYIEDELTQEGDYAAHSLIEGILTKLRNGKKIAEMKAKFAPNDN